MDYADKLDMMDDDCDIQGYPLPLLQSFVARQKCNSCGIEFNIEYFSNGNYHYIDEPCECEDSFSPCEGVPSISEWLKQIK